MSSIFTGLFDIIGIPLGWLLKLIYSGIPNYFLAIFLFTLLIRILLFPLSLKSQKSQAERAKLAPRLERLRKKYEKDPKKLQEKQQALYEKEGVSLTGGCLPTIVQMLILFGIISVIYSPLTHLSSVPKTVVDASVTAISASKDDPEIAAGNKIVNTEFSGYYKELRLLKYLDQEPYAGEIKAGISALEGNNETTANQYYKDMQQVKNQFTVSEYSLLENPWGSKGFAGISLLWLIPLLSGITALLTSLISMKFTRQLTAGQNQPGQGCTTGLMLIWMPAFSLFIAFTVPGGVGIYWICSNIIALVQTLILNSIYNPAKIREQAEIEYQEKRKQRQEDKKRLAEARAREQRELAQSQKPADTKNTGKKKKDSVPAEQPAETEEKQSEPQEEKTAEDGND